MEDGAASINLDSRPFTTMIQNELNASIAVASRMADENARTIDVPCPDSGQIKAFACLDSLINP
jgi:hypothetical protein